MYSRDPMKIANSLGTHKNTDVLSNASAPPVAKVQLRPSAYAMNPPFKHLNESANPQK